MVNNLKAALPQYGITEADIIYEVPVEGGILLETTQMNKILELDTNNMTVTVQPGVLLMELAAFAEENEFMPYEDRT